MTSNRAARRAAIADFRRQAERELETFLCEAGTDLDDYPSLAQARLRWSVDMALRKPSCIACRASFAGDAKPAAHLFATAPPARMVSVSCYCSVCWSGLTDAELESAASKVLRRICPSGRFSD
jgi:hypothetical protein